MKHALGLNCVSLASAAQACHALVQGITTTNARYAQPYCYEEFSHLVNGGRYVEYSVSTLNWQGLVRGLGSGGDRSGVLTLWFPSAGGRFKEAYELLNLRALKFSVLYEMYIFQCMGKIFCVEFQRVPLKFHTKYLTHTLKDVDFIHQWKFKSS